MSQCFTMCVRPSVCLSCVACSSSSISITFFSAWLGETRDYEYKIQMQIHRQRLGILDSNTNTIEMIGESVLKYQYRSAVKRLWLCEHLSIVPNWPEYPSFVPWLCKSYTHTHTTHTSHTHNLHLKPYITHPTPPTLRIRHRAVSTLQRWVLGGRVPSPKGLTRTETMTETMSCC